jgi:hypothetical protein
MYPFYPTVSLNYTTSRGFPLAYTSTMAAGVSILVSASHMAISRMLVVDLANVPFWLLVPKLLFASLKYLYATLSLSSLRVVSRAKVLR